MTSDNVSAKQAVVALMEGAVPERWDDIRELWQRYNVSVELVADAKRITLNANRDRIAFSAKTMDVFWLVGFSGWKAIESYAPLVIWSARSGQSIACLISRDEGLGQVERAYKERHAAARDLIEAADSTMAQWPPDIPRPSANRDWSNNAEYKVAFDLTCMAAAFAFFHEFHHVMLERDNVRPPDLREEELMCDVWARSFMTVKLAQYAKDHGHNFEQVMRKRAMGFALAALILHEVTPVWDHGGNRQYFSIGDRFQTMLDNTPVGENDHFAVLAASVLIGIFRQKHIAIDAPPTSARDLTTYLISKL
jgi:hypothetical protein